MPSHREIDLRSLELHKYVAEKVRNNEALLNSARATLARWRATASPRTFVYLDAWQRLLDQGTEPCLAAATEPSEWGDAMRQASPLACLLTNAERYALLKSWKRRHAPH